MKIKAITPVFLCSALFACASLTGCATPSRPLYYWGDYQPGVYSYFKKQESPETQLGKLEVTVQKAQSEGLPLPPGFNAHLGLLYLQTGQGGKAQMAFQTEKTRFPEAAPYMDFLLKNKTAVTTMPAPTIERVMAPASPIKEADMPAKASTK